jgi:hypothetical protein
MAGIWKLPNAQKGFGVELEFHIPSYIVIERFVREESKFFSLFKNNYRLNSYCLLKSDCSAGRMSYNGWGDSEWDGLEVNLGIFPLNNKGINHFQETLDAIYDDLRIFMQKYKYKKPFSRGCGFHVHLSRSLFERQNSLANFYGLFHQYQKDIFSQLVHKSRDGNTYSRKLLGTWETDDHYVCVNRNTRHHTIEIRHAGMTSNKETMVNWTKFIQLMHHLSQCPAKLSKFKQNDKLMEAIDGLSRATMVSKDRFMQWVESTDEDRFSLNF